MNIDRRGFLQCCAAGATAGVLTMRSALAQAAALQGAGPLPPLPTHFPPRAKRLIFVFLMGGMSHVDTFDYKPRLVADQGKVCPKLLSDGKNEGRWMPSPFKFARYGQSGLLISELFQHLGSVADDLCVLRTMRTDVIDHVQAVLAMHTGLATLPLPSIGAWLSYGLGTFNQNLPAYMVLAKDMPFGGSQVWDSVFLPPIHQGVRVVPGDDPIPDLRNGVRDATVQQVEQMMLDDLDRKYVDARPGDLNLRARTDSFTIARGMMGEAPAAFDLRDESPAALAAYGIAPGDKESFGWRCLMARRLIERGVRVVELIDTGAGHNWDAHADIQEHLPRARFVDQPLAALIRDLKQRGLLDETLIAVCSEFGRTPTTVNGAGRDHFIQNFTCLLAGGGVRGGLAHGETDEHGVETVRDGVHLHDYHATILHLMGIDHTRLTYRYAGRDYRLTDVHGRVVKEILS